MPDLTKSVILLALLACAGCAKPNDIGEARREHILGGPHGWIDVTVHAPAAPASAAAATPRAGRTGADPASDRPSPACELQFVVDGESVLRETADLAQADATGHPMGWRFPVSTGARRTELDIQSCVADRLAATLAIDQRQDQLALVEFDGTALVLKATQLYVPATLDTVSRDVGRLDDRGAASEARLATLTHLVIASVALNLVVLAALFLRRR
jgi:hypothetical protein